ncbi:MAG: BMP family ABC transporter substrate-binding protein, partial [Clostridia bacterium]|nr:BMP family ABC transporter substrate-binding protein [Clostridia bacterium]
GAPTACEENGVPNVSYNGSTKSVGATTYIVSSRINWVPYFKYIIQQTLDGKKVDTDWTGTMKNGSVEILEVNEDVAAAGTTAKLAEVKAKLLDGTLHVFDTATFTVGGEKLADGTLADVDSDANYTADTAVVKNGIFEESKYRSAPYFGVRIDGITELTKAAA